MHTQRVILSVIAILLSTPALAQLVTENQKITAPVGQLGFGRYVTVEGNVAAISSNTMAGGGAVLLYHRAPDGLWVFDQALHLPASAFGEVTAIDGSWLVIGDRHDDEVVPSGGAVYVYQKQSNGLWQFVTKLFANDAATIDRFGTAVDVAGDTIVIGAHADNDGGPGSGSVYVFKPDGLGGFVQVQKIVPADNQAGDNFGGVVSLEGGLLLVSAINNFVGAVYTFADTGGGFVQLDKFFSTVPGAHRFGYTLARSGPVLAVGAPGTTPGGEYVSIRDYNGVDWVESEIVLVPDTSFGYSCYGATTDLIDDRLVVGANCDKELSSSTFSDSGAAHVYVRSGTFNRVAKLVASDALTEPLVGYGVGINDDAILLGAPLADKIAEFTFSGAVYVYDWDRILDSDGDGVTNVGDRCPDTESGDVVDANGCAIAQLCPCAGPIEGGLWRNHEQYVSCVSSAANNFVRQGLITNRDKRAIVTTAAQSQCGK